MQHMIYTILFYRKGAVIAAQETFASWDDAIGDIIAYGYDAHAIIELQEDGTTQACTGSALECFIEQYLDEQKEA
jgi:hypothetical protein|tara:strand:- start:799 stop:1023 length:225 start_codon:yes stop_codon:yes gene_type:complete